MADSQKIKVLIVDDIAETRENIRKLLQFEKDMEVVGAASSGKSGIELSRELNPDVVLMDINMPDMDGITATELIRQNSAATQIVILSVQGDPNYMRRAMLAGARDFITKPPAVDDLTAAIRRAGKMAHEERAKLAAKASLLATAGASAAALQALGKVILVYSPKGGAGVTMTAINLAVTLQSPDAKVAVVDGNLQFGDVAVFLNEQVRNSILELAPRADELDPDIIEGVMIHNAASGLHILAAPPKPEYAENVNGEQFGKVLDYLRNQYSYIVVDASSTLTDIVLAAVDQSDLIILIVTQDIPAIKSARLFLDLLDVMGVARRRVLLIMNRFDRRIGIMPEKVGESFKHEVVTVIPFEDRVVIPSINRGVPFMIAERARPNSAVAKAVLQLAEVTKQRLSEMTIESVERASASAKR